MVELTQKFEKRVSIEVAKNAKGEMSWKIKIYYDADEQECNMVVRDIKNIHEKLASIYYNE